MNPSATGLAKVVNHLLARAPWARERLLPYSGSVLRLQLDPLRFDFEIDASGLLSAPAAAGDRGTVTDVTVSLPLGQLPAALIGGSATLMNAVSVQGNAELADAIGFVFRNLEWDAEDDLARVIGDIPAHRIADTARALKRNHDRAIAAFGANLSEYFAEEQAILVTQGLTRSFEGEIRSLRDDLARLEKRVLRLGKSVPLADQTRAPSASNRS